MIHLPSTRSFRIALSLGSLALLAQSPSVRAGFLLDVTGSYSLNTLTGLPSSSGPTLFDGSVGATLGYRFWGWLLIGASTHYDWISQTSSPAPPVGNWGGTRWSYVAPTMGLYVGRFSLRGSYEFLGNYNLSTQAADGSTVSYTSPSGFDATLAYTVYPHAKLGVFYRRLSYTTQSSSSGGDTTLATPLGFSQYGLSLTIELFGGSSGASSRSFGRR